MGSLAEVSSERDELRSEVAEVKASLSKNMRSARDCVHKLYEAGSGYAFYGYKVWIVDLLYEATDACEAATGEQFHPYLGYDF